MRTPRDGRRGTGDMQRVVGGVEHVGGNGEDGGENGGGEERAEGERRMRGGGLGDGEKSGWRADFIGKGP